jgi:predicted secreted protein
MAVFSGVVGKVVVDADTVLNISDWSLDIKQATQKYADFGQTWENVIGGIRSASGSCKGQLNTADTTGQVEIITGLTAGTSVAMKLYYDTSTCYTLASCYISSIKISDKADGMAEVDISFEVNGAVS